MTQTAPPEQSSPPRPRRSVVAPGLTRRQRFWGLQHRLAPYLFVSPFVLLFATFMVYPLGRSFWLSFHKTIGPRRELFVGLDNYAFLLHDRIFWLAFANTAAYTVAFLAVQIPCALGLAILLNCKWVVGRSVWRFAFFSTHLVGSVFVAVLFSLLLSPRSGLLNGFLSLFTTDRVEIDWLGKPQLAMVSVLLASLWLSIGYAMIYFLAALQAVDRELYEAAEVDGAGRWSKFWHITLPGIRPVLVLMVFVGMIGGFQLFELPWVLFQQGPGPNNAAMTLVMYLYVTGFGVNNLGYASAIGWALVLILLVITGVQIKLFRPHKEHN